MKVKAYIYHKRAEKYCDCQDCFGINPECNRIAISDGMSQSIYPQRWAKILVDSFLQTGTMPADIKSLQSQWQDFVTQEIHRREAIGKNPWLLKNSVIERHGAGATLCGMTWEAGKWECKCLGDSCLIVVKKDYTLRICTSQIGEFGNYPDYYDSFNDGKGEAQDFSGDFSDVFVMLLVTDPFSELFQKHEKDAVFIKNRLDEIRMLSNHQSFVNLVEKWRDEYSMHNDDSTLILLQEFDNSALEISHRDSLDKLCESDNNVRIEASTIVSGAKLLTEVDSPPVIGTSDESEDINANLKKAFIEWLQNYTGKPKDGKIKDSLWTIVYPLVKDYIKKRKV